MLVGHKREFYIYKGKIQKMIQKQYLVFYLLCYKLTKTIPNHVFFPIFSQKTLEYKFKNRIQKAITHNDFIMETSKLGGK